MKKQLILGSFLALASLGQSQTWTSSTGQLTTTGKVGIGTTGPGKMLDIKSRIAYDGLRITQTNDTSGAHCTLRLTNNGGHDYGFASSGAGSSEGPGHFMLYDYTAGNYNFFISGGGSGYAPAGHIGIGTTNPIDSKLHVVRSVSSYPSSGLGNGGLFEITTNQLGVYNGVYGNCTSSFAGGGGDFAGVCGKSAGNGSTSHGTSYGVVGTAMGNYYNFGGYFEVQASSNSVLNYGVFGNANGVSGAYAGFFQGNVYATGVYQGSDLKLKENIKSMTGVLDKIKLLKPSTYTFKRSEFPGMSLPEGSQIGLIAQDLEKVYPELISEIAERIAKNSKGEIIKNPNFKSVNYIGLIPVLISGMQEQQTQIENMQKQLNEQKQMMADLTNSSNNTNRKVEPMGVNDIQGANGFAMEQNIPNPFSSETVIKYTLTPQTKTAALIVYDLSGKQINSFPLENGTSSITITSEKLQAGIYIYSIMVDGKIMDSKRMVVAQK